MPLRTSHDSGRTEAAPSPVARLGSFLAGRLVASELPDALNEALTALGRRLELRDISWDRAAARPRIDGLPEAGLALSEAKERMPGEMTNSPAEPARLRHLGGLVVLKRALLELTVSFSRWLEADLAVDENALKAAVLDGYEPVRVPAARNRSLGLLLQPAEQYLYGAAQQAAETRSANLSSEKKLEEKIGARVYARGVEEGKRIAADTMSSALDELREREPPADPADPGDRRGSSR